MLNHTSHDSASGRHTGHESASCHPPAGENHEHLRVEKCNGFQQASYCGGEPTLRVESWLRDRGWTRRWTRRQTAGGHRLVKHTHEQHTQWDVHLQSQDGVFEGDSFVDQDPVSNCLTSFQGTVYHSTDGLTSTIRTCKYIHTWSTLTCIHHLPGIHLLFIIGF